MQLFANNASTLLAADLSDSATAVIVQDASGFPVISLGGHYLLTLVEEGANSLETDWEVLKVTGASDNTLTVTRAQEGTAAKSWASGTKIELRLTAGSLDTLRQWDSIRNKPTTLNGFGITDATAENVGADPEGTAISVMTGHASDPDAHPQYVSEQDVLWAINSHESAVDPHPQYTTAAEAAAAAPVQSVAGKTGAVTLAKGDVGLGNVDNTSDADKPVSTATQTALNGKALTSHTHAISDVTGLKTALDGKAPLASPAFTGTPTVPTAAAGTNTTQVASTAFVAKAVSNLVASSPAALDTLNELAAALGNDANFATTMTNALAGKLNTSASTASGLALLGAADVAAQRSSLGLANHQLVTVDGSGNTTIQNAAVVTRGAICFVALAPSDDTHSWRMGTYSHSYAGGSPWYLQYDGSTKLALLESGRLLLNTTDNGSDLLQVGGSGKFSGNLSSTGFTQIVGDFGSNAFEHSALYLSPDSAYGARFIGGIRQGEGGELQLQIRNNGAHTTVLRVPSSGVVHAVRGLIVPNCADDAAAAAANIPVGAIYRTGTTLKVRAA